ncbi:MAG: DUF5115 domain-containing protein [Bacteroidaceae bacterium]|nr:DUF5115 domain-containing protein [Bacteroidaceae bacterium]
MIKKILYGLTLLAGMVSCTEDFTDWAKPQSNAANEAAQPVTLSVQPVCKNILFEDIDTDSIELFTGNLGIEKISGYDVAISSADDLGDTPIHLDASIDGKVSTAELKDAVIEMFGRSPKERNLDVVVSAIVKVATDDGSITTRKSAQKFNVSALLDTPYISQNYYLIGDPIRLWDPQCVIMPFVHKGAGSVYDEPEFSVVFPVKAGETWFAITDDVTVLSGEWDNVLGCVEGDGKNGSFGYLARRTMLKDNGSWKIVAEKDCQVRLTLNMMEYSYKIEILAFDEFVGVIGNHNGWGADEPIASPGFDGEYQGYLYLNGDFKIRQKASWDNKDTWGGNGVPGQLEQPGANLYAETGFYQINANLAENTYSLVPVTSITCVGNHNGWNQADAAHHMTYNVAEKCWEGTFNLTNGFKFAMNDAWDISWGGANGSATSYDLLTEYNGKDLNVPNGDGKYSVKLYLTCEGKHKVVLTKQ